MMAGCVGCYLPPTKVSEAERGRLWGCRRVFVAGGGCMEGVRKWLEWRFVSMTNGQTGVGDGSLSVWVDGPQRAWDQQRVLSPAWGGNMRWRAPEELRLTLLFSSYLHTIHLFSHDDRDKWLQHCVQQLWTTLWHVLQQDCICAGAVRADTSRY